VSLRRLRSTASLVQINCVFSADQIMWLSGYAFVLQTVVAEVSREMSCLVNFWLPLYSQHVTAQESPSWEG
jgi:hypothetical protein